MFTVELVHRQTVIHTETFDSITGAIEYLMKAIYGIRLEDRRITQVRLSWGY